MNRWLQTKRYRCPACWSMYLHDKAYRHQLFDCPRRPTLTGSKGTQHGTATKAPL